MNVLQTVILAAGLSALSFLVRLYFARSFVSKLRSAQLPMPEFKFLLGHLLTIKEATLAFPKDTVMHSVFWDISKQFPAGLYYIDLWPFARTTLVVTTPAAAIQIEDLDLSVPEDIIGPIEGITGGPSLLTMPIGPEWKTRRKALSSTFSATSMMSFAPAVAEQVAIFREVLLERCQAGTSDIFQLEDLTLRLTFDVIGVVTLGTRLRYQTRDNDLAKAMRRQIEWTSFTVINPLQRFISLRPIVLWFNGRLIDRYLAGQIDERAKARVAHAESARRHPSILDLLLEGQEKGGIDIEGNREIKNVMIPQIRAFLFGGHDTTSSTLLYCYYLLAEHPDVLNKVLAEHDEVFGADPTKSQTLIDKDPYSLNKLSYTTAVIKEVLRLFPPAASMRIGRQGATIADDDGRVYPTEGCNVWTLTLAIHHNPRFWPDPEAFIPERWLVDPGHELYPVKGAWRPFQHGPKNCLGQPLAMLELKICLVMTLREFTITPAYNEWDTMHPRRGVQTVNGHRAYQAEKGGGGAHPADGFPVRVTPRKR